MYNVREDMRRAKILIAQIKELQQQIEKASNPANWRIENQFPHLTDGLNEGVNSSLRK